MKIHLVFNVSVVHPYEPDPISNHQPAPSPPPVIVGPAGEVEWEVEHIDNARQ